MTEVAELRHTPAGLPVLGFNIRHVSRQTASSMPRQVECEIQVVAMAAMAGRAAILKTGSDVKVAGFLNKKSLNSRQLVLHIDELEIIEKG